jgi:hypothetical protein
MFIMFFWDVVEDVVRMGHLLTKVSFIMGWLQRDGWMAGLDGWAGLGYPKNNEEHSSSQKVSGCGPLPPESFSALGVVERERVSE